MADGVARDLLIVDQQHARLGGQLLHQRRAEHRLHRGLRGLQRHLDPAGGALARLAVHPDATAHQRDQPARDGQAQAGTAVLAAGGGVGLLERLEDARELLGRHADAGVLHLEAQPQALGLGRQRPHAQCDVARIGELDRVAGKVQQHLTEAQQVAVEHRRHAVHVNHQLEVAAARAVDDQREHIVDHLLHAEVGHLQPQLAGLDLRQVQDVVDDVQQVFGRGGDLAHLVELARVVEAAAQQVRQAQDRIHRRADLVAHVGQEIALGAVGLIGLLACSHQLGVGLRERRGAHLQQLFGAVAVLLELFGVALELRNVLEDTDVVGDAALVVAQRRKAQPFAVDVAVARQAAHLAFPAAVLLHRLEHGGHEQAVAAVAAQQRDRMAHHVIEGVAGDAGEGRVDVQKAQLVVGDHDAVAAFLVDAAEQAQLRVARLQVGHQRCQRARKVGDLALAGRHGDGAGEVVASDALGGGIELHQRAQLPLQHEPDQRTGHRHAHGAQQQDQQHQLVSAVKHLRRRPSRRHRPVELAGRVRPGGHHHRREVRTAVGPVAHCRFGLPARGQQPVHHRLAATVGHALVGMADPPVGVEQEEVELLARGAAFQLALYLPEPTVIEFGHKRAGPWGIGLQRQAQQQRAVDRGGHPHAARCARARRGLVDQGQQHRWVVAGLASRGQHRAPLGHQARPLDVQIGASHGFERRAARRGAGSRVAQRADFGSRAQLRQVLVELPVQPGGHALRIQREDGPLIPRSLLPRQTTRQGGHGQHRQQSKGAQPPEKPGLQTQFAQHARMLVATCGFSRSVTGVSIQRCRKAHRQRGHQRGGHCRGHRRRGPRVGQTGRYPCAVAGS